MEDALSNDIIVPEQIKLMSESEGIKLKRINKCNLDG